MPRSRGFALAALTAAGLVAVGLAIRFGPAVSLTLALVAPATEGWFHPLGAQVVREEITVPASGADLPADLYRPARARGALLLVHGLSRAGRRHPDLTRVARLLAKRGHLVLVPQFEGLTAFRLAGPEVDNVRAALDHLRGLGPGRLGVAGFSFGGGPALLAAASVPECRLAASFGGYADLRHVVAYITTGIHAFGGRRHVERQAEYNRWKLLAMLAGFLEDPRDRALIEALAAQKLGDTAAAGAPPNAPGKATLGEATLGEEGRAVLALVENRDPEAVEPLLARLPRGARAALDSLSPLPAVRRFPGRLLLAHGVADDSIPFTESLRLAEAAGGRARVIILHGFHHTGPHGLLASLGQRARDGWSLIGLIDDLLP